MRCLVTGCAGFVGSHLTDALLAQGCVVVGVDALTPTYDRTDKERNIEAARAHERFRWVEADLITADLSQLLAGVEVVFHLAGEPGVRQSWGERFSAYTRNNVLATERLLEACQQQALHRFVFAGSSSIYGDSTDLPWRETTCPQPRSPYAITKLAAEHLCHAYRLGFGVPTVILRYFTVYGPRQRPDMAFHRFLRSALRGDPIIVFGDGTQTREFTYVSDVVAATIAAATADDAIGGVFNIGGGSHIALNDLLRLMGEVTGQTLVIERREQQVGDVPHTWADTSRAASVLNYHPRVSLAEGLAQEWSWMQTNFAVP